MVLNETEIRLLGVMIEKSLTQPAGYPMTLNAITHGANQLHNRDPVTQYSENDMSAALRTLQHKKLVAQAPPSPGARANRFEHKVVEVFHWDRRDQAVMAELMLRGRQTAGELRSRASRMTALQDIESVTAILQGLKSHDPPFVDELPREPGRSANRFRHLLLSEAAGTDAPPSAVFTAGLRDFTTDRSEERSIGARDGAGAGTPDADHFAERLEALSARLVSVESRVDALGQRLAALCESLGVRVDEPTKEAV